MNGKGDFSLKNWTEEKWKEEPISNQTWLLKQGIESLQGTCHTRKKMCRKEMFLISLIIAIGVVVMFELVPSSFFLALKAILKIV